MQTADEFIAERTRIRAEAANAIHNDLKGTHKEKAPRQVRKSTPKLWIHHPARFTAFLKHFRAGPSTAFEILEDQSPAENCHSNTTKGKQPVRDAKEVLDDETPGPTGHTYAREGDDYASSSVAKDGLRMVVTMYLYIPLFPNTIENINADNLYGGGRLLAVRRPVEDAHGLDRGLQAVQRPAQVSSWVWTSSIAPMQGSSGPGPGA
ncbi:hypothetical protein CDV55_102746 [Aspergillus turcosus]|nr:hypothetical protein CDV55_102746 [Aspergillus turcosus]